MVDETKSLMELISESVTHKESTIRESEEKVLWYPILQFTTQGFILGLHRNGFWILESEDEVIILNDTYKFWRLVSLLEQSMNDIRKELMSFFDILNIVINPDNFFPFIEITQAGFQFGSKYWAELAFKWYEEIPLEKKVYFTESLTKIENAKWASQKLRHMAKKELKKLRIIATTGDTLEI